MRKVEEELWRREAEEDDTDSQDDVGIVDGIYAEESEEMWVLYFKILFRWKVNKNCTDCSLVCGTKLHCVTINSTQETCIHVWTCFNLQIFDGMRLHRNFETFYTLIIISVP